MRSTMMDVPLQVSRLLEHGSRVHAGSLVVTATADGPRRATFAEVGRNAARLAHALDGLGIGSGDRVATFMWNNQEHVEAYLGVPSMGAVLHPLNIRLFPEQIVWIANHAEDRVVIVDGTLLPLFAKLLAGMKTVEHVVVNGAGDLSLLDGATAQVHAYADLLAERPDTYDWPEVPETEAAAMCYSSGTTGDPKGVVYSHRSIYLHSMGIALPDVFDLSARDSVLSVVPQFHVLAWGLPYAAFLTGTSMVMPDRFLAPEPLAAFVAAAKPNKAAGVPTVWAGLIQHAATHPAADLSSLAEAVVGGAACPPSLLDAYDAAGVRLVHAWGMTETSPLGTLARVPVGADPQDERRYRLTQGRFIAAVQSKLVGPDGSELAWDDESVGELLVRGPWITGAYYGEDEPDPAKFAAGWLRTGDVGRISADGFLTLTDRSKDVIKSGGEWISSVELESQLMAHPGVAEASVVGVPDEKWGERPLAAVVRAEGQAPTVEELREFLAERVARWQVPERWTFVDEVPKTSVGKFDKKAIRAAHAAGELDVETAGT